LYGQKAVGKLEMGFSHTIRGRLAALSCLACFMLCEVAIAQTDSTAAAKKPAHRASAKKTTEGKTTSSTHATVRHISTTKSTHGKKTTKSSKTAKKRGQQAIDGDRARAIQEALIREHYLQGEPSGTWDGATQLAMQRYQADHGWQAKTTPDSRALIKLGLGPSQDHLLNPESAMTMPAAAPADADPKAKPTSGDDKVPNQ
jgi:hypothetical protein